MASEQLNKAAVFPRLISKRPSPREPWAAGGLFASHNFLIALLQTKLKEQRSGQWRRFKMAKREPTRESVVLSDKEILAKHAYRAKDREGTESASGAEWQPGLAESLTRKRGGVLSARELDVLHWLALGKSGGEIGHILGISVCTVRVHIRNIIRKLDVSNIPHAVAFAFKMGILKERR